MLKSGIRATEPVHGSSDPDAGTIESFHDIVDHLSDILLSGSTQQVLSQWIISWNIIQATSILVRNWGIKVSCRANLQKAVRLIHGLISGRESWPERVFDI